MLAVSNQLQKHSVGASIAARFEIGICSKCEGGCFQLRFSWACFVDQIAVIILGARESVFLLERSRRTNLEGAVIAPVFWLSKGANFLLLLVSSSPIGAQSCSHLQRA